MKVKGKIVSILLLFIVLLAIINVNQVKATDEKEVTIEVLNENVQKILEAIPNNMELDIPEVEYKKATKLVENKLDEIFEGKQLNLDETTIDIFVPDYLGIEEFYKATISINSTDNSFKRVEKIIDIKYNNTDNHNSEDEEYVKGLDLGEKKYFAINIEEWNEKSSYEIASEYYTNLINDNTVTAICNWGAGGPEGPFTNFSHGSINLLIFKDGILYDYRKVDSGRFVGQVNVPSSISDSELEAYLKNTIPKYYEYGCVVESVEEGTEEGIYENGYTITYSFLDNDYIETVPIIINREKEINITDTETNVKINTTTDIVPAGTELVVEIILNGDTYNRVQTALSNDVNKFVVYNINLTSEDVEVQPNGKVKISISIPNDFDTSNLIVYRIEEDGTKTKYDVTVEEEYAVFETDHFSTYVLAEEKEQVQDNGNSNNNGNNNGIIDDTVAPNELPQTGQSFILFVSLGVVTVLTTIITILYKKVKY